MRSTEEDEFGDFAPAGLAGRIVRATRAATADGYGRRRVGLLRALAMRLLGDRPVDLETYGARMRLYPQDNLCERRLVFAPQNFDARERDFFAARIRPDMVFVDIGANIGAYSLCLAALAGPGARILAIEPHPAIHARLAYNVRQSAFATIKTLECALADVDGEATLFVGDGNLGESSICLLPNREAGRLRVRAHTLARIAAAEGLERIDALKIDCEGAEDLVLEPFFAQADPRLRPRALMIERNPDSWSLDLIALTRDLGYNEVLRTEQNIAFELKESS